MSKKPKSSIPPVSIPVHLTAPPPAPEQPIAAVLQPKDDMTAAELASLLYYVTPRMVTPPMFQADWDRLGTATRHLVRT